MADLRSIVIGLGIPTLAVTVVPALIASSPRTILGVPLLFAWLFACFPLTTACLAISWHVFDKGGFDERGDPE